MKEIEVSFSVSEKQGKDALADKCSKSCGVSPDKIAHIEVLRRSIDARGGKITFKYRAQLPRIWTAPKEKRW